VLSLRPGSSLRGKTHRSDPVSTRSRRFETRSVLKRRPELVLQTLASVNVRWWSFPAGSLTAGGSSTADASLYAGGGPWSTGGSTVSCISELLSRTASGTSRYRWAAKSCRGCCGDCLWTANGGALWTASGSLSVVHAMIGPGAKARRCVSVNRLCYREPQARCSLWSAGW